MKIFLTFILFVLGLWGYGQNQMKWPDGKQALIVLTYDDALASQLEIAIPQLDKANIKATFFLSEPKKEQHITQWKAASQNGHELGNHSLFHPCSSRAYPADPRYYSDNYSVANVIREISLMNKMLIAMDNKIVHTYAYPCGETSVGGRSYVDSLRKSGFVKYARALGSSPIITNFKNLDPFLVPCKGFQTNAPAADLINFVKSVQQSRGMAVLIFHGVGGDYLDVSAEVHQQLIHYLDENRNDIWITTFEEAMDYVTKNLK